MSNNNIPDKLNEMNSVEMGIEICDTHNNAEFIVTTKNNFTRLFELPNRIDGSYCFAGGHQVEFRLKDWFYPIPTEQVDTDKGLILKGQSLLDSRNRIRDFIKSKGYYNPEIKYLMITNYGDTYII